MAQSRLESFLESCTSTAVGFVVSLAVWKWVISPIWGINQSIGGDLGIIGIFTITSILRQYWIRRAFDGNIYQWVRHNVKAILRKPHNR